MEYILHIFVFVGIYAILAVSLDLVAGHTGFLSIAQAAFYGIGAYTSSLLVVRLGSSFSVSTIACMLVAVIISFFVSLPSLRLHDDYFVIVTFGFQMIIFSIFNNWASLTRGPLGISNIPPPSFFGIVVQSHGGFIVMVATLAALAQTTVHLLSTSPFGRVLHTIREDEVFAQAMGKNTLKFKVSAFAVSAALAALAGSLYAHYITFIDPTSFTIMESVLIISMVIIGGAGSKWGPLIGAAVLVVLPEALRFVGLPSAVAANLRQVIYGLVLVVMMMIRPRGLVGKYGFGR